MKPKQNKNFFYRFKKLIQKLDLLSRSISLKPKSDEAIGTVLGGSLR